MDLIVAFITGRITLEGDYAIMFWALTATAAGVLGIATVAWIQSVLARGRMKRDRNYQAILASLKTPDEEATAIAVEYENPENKKIRLIEVWRKRNYGYTHRDQWVDDIGNPDVDMDMIHIRWCTAKKGWLKNGPMFECGKCPRSYGSCTGHEQFVVNAPACNSQGCCPSPAELQAGAVTDPRIPPGQVSTSDWTQLYFGLGDRGKEIVKVVAEAHQSTDTIEKALNQVITDLRQIMNGGS